MPITYNYTNGSMTPFALKRTDGVCTRNPDRTVLIGITCRGCKDYNGIRNGCVICTHHTKDDPGEDIRNLRYEITEGIRDEALRALDY